MAKTAIVRAPGATIDRQGQEYPEENKGDSRRQLLAGLIKTSLCLLGIICAATAPVAAFNAPQPIVQSDFLKLNGTEDGSAKTPAKPQTVKGSVSAGPSTPVNPGGAPPEAPITVTQALNEGLLRSPRVASARAQLEISKALYTQATMMPNPSLFRDEGAIAEQNRRLGMQTFIQPPWKVAFRLLAAKRQVQQTKLEILTTLWQYRNDLRRTYTGLVVAEQTYQTVGDLSDLAKRLETITQQRFSAGDVPELDVMKAQLATAQTEIELEWTRRRVLRAKQQLNVMLARAIDQAIEVSKLPVSNFKSEKSELLPDFDKPVPPLRDFVELAQANRLELRTTKQAIAVAQAQLYNAVGSIVPDAGVGAGDSSAGNPSTGPKLHGIFVTLNLELPLYSFQQGDIARLKATVVQLKRQIRAQENQILGEVSQAYNTLMAARERLRVYQNKVLAESEEVVRLARRSYEVGQSDITSTLAAQQANVQVRSQYLDAVAAYQDAFTDLEQASGEPLQ